jgi:hypothetical protein
VFQHYACFGNVSDVLHASFRDIDECDETHRNDHGVTGYKCVNAAPYDDAAQAGAVSTPICTNTPASYE